VISIFGNKGKGFSQLDNLPLGITFDSSKILTKLNFIPKTIPTFENQSTFITQKSIYRHTKVENTHGCKINTFFVTLRI